MAEWSLTSFFIQFDWFVQTQDSMQFEQSLSLRHWGISSYSRHGLSKLGTIWPFLFSSRAAGQWDCDCDLPVILAAQSYHTDTNVCTSVSIQLTFAAALLQWHFVTCKMYKNLKITANFKTQLFWGERNSDNPTIQSLWLSTKAACWHPKLQVARTRRRVYQRYPNVHLGTSLSTGEINIRENILRSIRTY